VIAVPTARPLESSGGADRVTTSSRGLSRTLVAAVLVAAAALLLVTLFAAIGSDRLGGDFRTYLATAESLREGQSPYPSSDSPLVDEGRAYVYPPQLAIALVPLTSLSVDVASALGFLAALGALLGALAVLGIRDMRCYAALLVSAPAWNALEMANFSAVLALGLALTWRFRSTLWPLATVLGLTVAAKLFVWPVLVWTVATRRVRAAALAVTVGVVVTMGAWAAIGFDGLTAYPRLLERLTEVHADDSYSFIGGADALGLDDVIGRLAMLVVGGGLLVACARHGHDGDDRRAFTCAVAAALALTPILWQHHLVILFVPLALARPRFSAIWLAPAVLWLAPRAGNGEGLEAFVPALVVTLVVVRLLVPAHAHTTAPAEVRA
jgi:hypothetical protein